MRSATCDPPGIGWPARAARPADRCRFFGCMTPPRVSSRWAVAAAAPVWRCSTRRTRMSTTSSPPRPTHPASSRISTCRSASPTRSCAPSNAAPRTAWSIREPARPLRGFLPQSCSTSSAEQRMHAEIPGWCSWTPSIGPTRCLGEVESRRPTRAGRFRCCRTSRATSARSTSHG